MKNLVNIALFMLTVLNFSFANPNALEFSSTPGNLANSDCRRDVRVIGSCFWVRGNLLIGSGNPATRLRFSGNGRIIGIKDDENPILPTNVSSVLTTENQIFGNYYFCPFSKYKRGSMQIGCIEKAKNLKVKRF